MTHVQDPAWPVLVEQIIAGSESAVEELYRSLRTVRRFLGRQLGPDHVDEVYNSLIIDLVVVIRKGDIRQPDALPAYAMTVARRKICAHIGEMIQERRNVQADKVMLRIPVSESPEQLCLQRERQDIAKRILEALPAKHRELLVRFYLNDESQEEITAAMGMSATQFRLIKSRAKLRYTELVQQAMSRTANPRSAAPAAA